MRSIFFGRFSSGVRFHFYKLSTGQGGKGKAMISWGGHDRDSRSLLMEVQTQ